MIEELPIIPILLFSVIIHEIAHGWVAMKLGDPTAKLLGRLTLNPLPHIDPVGSVLIPLMSLAATGHVLIAWARPVPVDPRNFLRPRRDNVLVSVVGPLSNLLMAFGCSLAVIALAHVGRGLADAEPGIATSVIRFLLTMFYGGMYINVVLGVFNLIPLPPLDGSHVIAALLPPRAAARYLGIGFLGVLLFLLAMRIPVVQGAFESTIGAVFLPFRSLVELFV